MGPQSLTVQSLLGAISIVGSTNEIDTENLDSAFGRLVCAWAADISAAATSAGTDSTEATSQTNTGRGAVGPPLTKPVLSHPYGKLSRDALYTIKYKAVIWRRGRGPKIKVDKQIQISYYGLRMFSQTAEYALRAIVVLSANPEKPWTAQDIAAESKVPQDYLMKVLQALGKEGLVVAQRGRGGGFLLRRQPQRNHRARCN